MHNGIMNALERDLCGAIIGWRIGGPAGAVVGAILCHILFPDEN